MDLWLLWLILGVAFAVGEIATLGFFLAPFALGAFAATLVALAGADGASILVFVLVSGLAFAFLRPIARRHTKMPQRIRTGTDALIGEQAMVLERIANAEAVGCVRIGGEIWTARSADDDRVIEAGTRV